MKYNIYLSSIKNPIHILIHINKHLSHQSPQSAGLLEEHKLEIKGRIISCRVWWPEIVLASPKASSPKPGSQGIPLVVGGSPSSLTLMTCYVSLLHCQVKDYIVGFMLCLKFLALF